MESRFLNMETSLNKLIDSMTTFNPSISAAEALMEADQALNDGISTRTLYLNIIKFTSYEVSLLTHPSGRTSSQPRSFGSLTNNGRNTR